jgi:hypothetical protein
MPLVAFFTSSLHAGFCLTHTVRKAELVERPKHVGDRKFRRPHRTIEKCYALKAE